jgi:hypothetical protein
VLFRVSYYGPSWDFDPGNLRQISQIIYFYSEIDTLSILKEGYVYADDSSVFKCQRPSAVAWIDTGGVLNPTGIIISPRDVTDVSFGILNIRTCRARERKAPDENLHARLVVSSLRKRGRCCGGAIFWTPRIHL